LRPRYAELAAGDAPIPGCAWGRWGDDDEVGAFNDVTAEHVVAAAGLVRRGAVFSLNWRLDLPSPPLFSRGPLRHVVHDRGVGLDDHLDNFFPQCSSQWDALSHYSHPRYGFYGGRSSADLMAEHPRNGIDNLAERGIAARFVLADVARWREGVGRPIDHAAGEPIPLADLRETLHSQGVSPQLGDVLLVRFGWVGWYERQDAKTRAALAPADRWAAAYTGLQPDEETVAWLWDSGAVAVAGDAVALEVFPFDPMGTHLHGHLIGLLGMPIGEMWALDALAADCAADGRYTGLLTAAPLNIRGGIGSPANALALK
jgi:kynurenine formamidase